MKHTNKKIASVLLALLLALSQLTIPVLILPSSAEQALPEEERGPVINMYMSPTSISIDRGQAFQLTALPQVSGAVSWSTQNSSIATVTQYGLVVGVSAGTTYITAMVDSLEPGINAAQCQVTVSSNGIVANGTYFIRSAQNLSVDQYIDVEGPSSSNGAKMQLWELTGAAQRKWTMTLGTDGYYRVKSNYSSKYMRVTGSSPTAGATITQNSSIVSGSKWALMRTAAGNYAFVPASSASSLVVLNSPGASNGYDLNTATYTANTNYKDEWIPIRMLPLSGSELNYSSSLTSWTRDEVELSCNCFAYAINNQIYPGGNSIWVKQQMGEYYSSSYSFSVNDESAIYDGIAQDFAKRNYIFSTNNLFGRINDKYDVCPSGTYKIALFATSPNSTYKDYHWYRQDADGLWSHKRGLTEVTRLDNSQKQIIDPELADRNYGNYNYTEFLGYYYVTPWNGEYTTVTNPTYYYMGSYYNYHPFGLLLNSNGSLVKSNKLFNLNIFRSCR
ncbi:MAG: RICIN domain-containing protein [Clostridia bacterium]|nr:RICIN domain-containing protein [Clostridia bacterium]